jgi:hypothetical protein
MIESIGHEVQVALGLGLGRKALAQAPLVVQLFGKPVLIDMGRQIDARAGITVPIPSAADVVAGFHGLHLESLLTQPIELVHAGDSSADDEGIELGGGYRGVHGRLLSIGVAGRSVAAGTAMRPGKCLRISTAQFGNVRHRGDRSLERMGQFEHGRSMPATRGARPPDNAGS